MALEIGCSHVAYGYVELNVQDYHVGSGTGFSLSAAFFAEDFLLLVIRCVVLFSCDLYSWSHSFGNDNLFK